MTGRCMFRYVVDIDDGPHTHPLTSDPVAVGVAVSGWSVEFWAEHTDGDPVRDRKFRVFGTGHPLPHGARWVGTCPRTPDGLVWHLFEVTS